MTKSNLPSFHSYGNYSSSNYGAHCLCFEDAQGNTFWYSYKTLVAFCKNGGQRIVQQNAWGPTTGKHLNLIDRGDKKNRLTASEFDAKFKEVFSGEKPKKAKPTSANDQKILMGTHAKSGKFGKYSLSIGK